MNKCTKKYYKFKVEKNIYIFIYTLLYKLYKYNLIILIGCNLI